MASQGELRNSDSEKEPKATDKNHPKASSKHGKGRPSVDVQLAQNYRERQDLPPIEQGVDPKQEGGNQEFPSSDAEYVEIVLDKRLKIDLQTTQSWPDERRSEADNGKSPRDYVTGRKLSQHGRSCLRCLEKGLRCTLNYLGKESDPQCAACRRSKAPHCVRFQPVGDHGHGIPFYGPPWKNPNFVAGGPAGKTVARLPSEQLEEMLREFYEGQKGYVMGQYMTASDVHSFALPPFNGADLPPIDRPENYEEMDWKDILPDWRNRSLQSPKKGSEKDDEYEKVKKTLALAREISLLPPNPDGEDAEAIRQKMARIKLTTSNNAQEEDISLLRIVRRYRPREKNLSDIV
ncbi:hypothetical protein F5B22DRAFT_657733 [Xylaria bambusicola]|uniref:uncharacterized protein n=1 Tax=Xylaria bambusicola TaxID=326684 RepID=UPI002007F111|nr:uncharacterized protein F5B22DRAFT_657733 [Xylaria bambusicola]KAI0512619.1 hypothetical protein F5B22DRAFT_657733 [Xylaria bambusicola]